MSSSSTASSSLDWLESFLSKESSFTPMKEIGNKSTGVSGVSTQVTSTPAATSIFGGSTDESSSLSIDPMLMNLLLQITDNDVMQVPSTPTISSLYYSAGEAPVSMNSDLRSMTATTADEVAIEKMKADAARDFNDWKQTKKLIKRLSRQDSIASTIRSI